MNDATLAVEATEPKKRTMNKLNIKQLHRVGEIFAKHTKNKGTDSARLDVTDREMAEILSKDPVIDKKVTHMSVAWYRKPANFDLKTCKRAKSVLWKERVPVTVKTAKRAYHRHPRTETPTGSVQVLIMNTAKIYKLLSKMAKKMRAV